VIKNDRTPKTCTQKPDVDIMMPLLVAEAQVIQ